MIEIQTCLIRQTCREAGTESRGSLWYKETAGPLETFEAFVSSISAELKNV